MFRLSGSGAFLKIKKKFKFKIKKICIEILFLVNEGFGHPLKFWASGGCFSRFCPTPSPVRHLQLGLSSLWSFNAIKAKPTSSPHCGAPLLSWLPCPISLFCACSALGPPALVLLTGTHFTGFNSSCKLFDISCVFRLVVPSPGPHENLAQCPKRLLLPSSPSPTWGPLVGEGREDYWLPLDSTGQSLVAGFLLSCERTFPFEAQVSRWASLSFSEWPTHWSAGAHPPYLLETEMELTPPVKEAAQHNQGYFEVL